MPTPAAQSAFTFDAALVGPRVYLAPQYRTFRSQLERYGAVPQQRRGSSTVLAITGPPTPATPRTDCRSDPAPVSPLEHRPLEQRPLSTGTGSGSGSGRQVATQHGADIRSWAAAAGISTAGQPPGGDAERPPRGSASVCSSLRRTGSADPDALGSCGVGGAHRSVSGSARSSNAVSDEGSDSSELVRTDGATQQQQQQQARDPSRRPPRHSGEEGFFAAHVPSELLSSLAGVRILEPRKAVLQGVQTGAAAEQQMRALAMRYGDVESYYARDADTAVITFATREAGDAFCTAAAGGSIDPAELLGATVSVGTTSYCPRFLRRRRCRDEQCALLHAFAPVSLYTL
eukprot:TRINITY_DN5029_c1_g1_i1.p1 TRINITY_DN5029_c1_g1~~TRINITY_DN5029_c1_g1_i1.p1  ORF type:complete len:374 (+),score=105.98 TRINITY_DN5029_c1_g1_i1:88-1122(+)